MMNSRRKDKIDIETTETPLTVEDVLRYLSKLAGLSSDLRTGNPDLSAGLHFLVVALKPYSATPLSELADSLKPEVRSANRPKKKKEPKVALPNDLKALNATEINTILDGSQFTKEQLAELGNKRFGISKSKLMRQSKSKLVQSIHAALQHEKSLKTISQEARRGGESRVS